MRKFALLLAAVLLFGSSFAVSVPASAPKAKAPKASEVYLKLGKNGELISLMDLAYAKPSEIQELTGKKMSLTDRLGFKMAQKKLRAGINKDGSINNKQLKKMAKKAAAGESGFHLGGFALGFLLGLIGVLIAYLINDDLASNRRKWAWIGVAAWLVILLVVLVV